MSSSLLDLLHYLFDRLLIWVYCLNPARKIPNDALVQDLANGTYLSVNTVHFEVLVEPKMNLDLLDRVGPLVKVVLDLVDLAEATLTENRNLLK